MIYRCARMVCSSPVWIQNYMRWAFKLLIVTRNRGSFTKVCQQDQANSGKQLGNGVVLRAYILTLMLVYPGFALVEAATAISAGVIEGLKDLPRSEQEDLARQHGVDLSIIQGNTGSTETIGDGIGEMGVPLEPVKTVFVKETTPEPQIDG